MLACTSFGCKDYSFTVGLSLMILLESGGINKQINKRSGHDLQTALQDNRLCTEARGTVCAETDKTITALITLPKVDEESGRLAWTKQNNQLWCPGLQSDFAVSNWVKAVYLHYVCTQGTKSDKLVIWPIASICMLMQFDNLPAYRDRSQTPSCDESMNK